MIKPRAEVCVERGYHTVRNVDDANFNHAGVCIQCGIGGGLKWAAKELLKEYPLKETV